MLTSLNTSISYYRLFWLIIISTLISCQNSSKQNQSIDDSNGKALAKNELTKVKKTLITVELGTKKSQVNIDEHHLYGKFFQDRAEFFVVENPDLYVSDTKVDNLTLYFIDSVLCKKKYEFKEDISMKLMSTYGSFKFRALNDSSKIISKHEGVLKKVNGKKKMNENLTYYRMRWTKQSPMLYYQYKRDSASLKVELIEELEDYKGLLKMAELSI